jgi:hypothetical protein
MSERPDLAPGTPRHPIVRTLRWIAAVVLATWLLWLLVARLGRQA